MIFQNNVHCTSFTIANLFRWKCMCNACAALHQFQCSAEDFVTLVQIGRNNSYVSVPVWETIRFFLLLSAVHFNRTVHVREYFIRVLLILSILLQMLLITTDAIFRVNCRTTSYWHDSILMRRLISPGCIGVVLCYNSLKIISKNEWPRLYRPVTFKSDWQFSRSSRLLAKTNSWTSFKIFGTEI